MAKSVNRDPIPRRLWLAYFLGCTPGFRRASCKKLLKLTMSRVKLLSRRREAQVRQLRIDVAQLLRRSQTSDAEARLDRLWKEACLLSVYLKVAQYCHLLKANLYNIAWQRECPIDLREAIESLYFAASHCSDLPELKDFREIMANKYGKDFCAGSLVSKQFLQAFYESKPPEDTRKALMRGICADFHVKYAPQEVEVSPKVSKQSFFMAVAAENSSSVHGQDVSYGSLDTHDVHIQGREFHHHKEIKSSLKCVTSDTHTAVGVATQVGGRNRGGEDLDIGAVRQIPKKGAHGQSQKPSHEKPCNEEVESRPVHVKMPLKREGNARKKHDCEEEDVKVRRMGSEDLRDFEKKEMFYAKQRDKGKLDGGRYDSHDGGQALPKPSSVKVEPEDLHGFEKKEVLYAKQRDKGKLDRGRHDSNDGQAWPKHSSVKVYDYDKAEMEALHESGRVFGIQKCNGISHEDMIAELRVNDGDERFEANRLKKERKRSARKYRIGMIEFDASPERNHDFPDEGITMKNHIEVVPNSTRKNHPHRVVQSNHEEHDHFEVNGKLDRIMTNERQFVDGDEFFQLNQRSKKESRHSRKKHSHRDKFPHGINSDMMEHGEGEEMGCTSKLPQHEDDYFVVKGLSRKSPKPAFDFEGITDGTTRRSRPCEMKLSMENEEARDSRYTSNPLQHEDDRYKPSLPHRTSRNDPKGDYEGFEQEQRFGSHGTKLSGGRGSHRKPGFDNGDDQDSRYNSKMHLDAGSRHDRAYEPKPPKEEDSSNRHNRHGGKIREMQREGEQHRRAFIQHYNDGHGGESSADHHQRVLHHGKAFAENHNGHTSQNVWHSTNGDHSSGASKPPDRPPPPVPTHRTVSLPNNLTEESQNPPVCPRRSNTFGPNRSRQQHVHPNLPEYEDLVATFAQFKREKSID